jgi:hypothetical protein
VVEVPVERRLLETEVRSKVVRVRWDDGRFVDVPLANVGVV